MFCCAAQAEKEAEESDLVQHGATSRSLLQPSSEGDDVSLLVLLLLFPHRLHSL